MRSLLLLSLVSAMLQAAPVSLSHFVSEGHAVGIEVFPSADRNDSPAIIFLHGSDGLNHHGDSYLRSAIGLAEQGFSVFLVHYFDRTGTGWANRETITGNFLTWMRTVSDAITYAQSCPGVDRNRIGILGTSLGASLGMMVAAQDARVAAVADFFGLIPDIAVPLIKRMPPTLILHGAIDPVVPVQEAYKLERLFKEIGVEFEATIYPQQGHVFTGSAAADSIQRTLEFFRKKLRPAA
jgi:dipeptidyl aminopeptidase/acylaminoacyl peptidase